MNKSRATLEVIAPTVEEAITKGLADLNLPEEAVEVEILDQGTRGLFGIGSRHARIRLLVKSASSNINTPVEAPIELTIPEPVIGSEIIQTSPITQMEESNEVRIARETVIDLLEKMKVQAHVTAQYNKVDEDRNRIPIKVDITGDDLSILIGRRAETLNALQYITGLIVSKELGEPVSLVIDVEGYRSRREGQLKVLARRMADQAIKTGRRQILEPMPASERRIVHIELRDNPSVKTESVGEEPRRKVTIIPKE